MARTENKITIGYEAGICMKPHKLTMKAFGPFADETTVDFDAMGNSIYLICGDTGAGKTTIFDGIMYALYGTASGGERSSLGTEAFHSDYARENGRREEMRVRLSFSNAGRLFTVERRMYWGKSGSAQRAVKESALSEGASVLHGKGREDIDDVTLKVKEILGLDADQFRRIIMLAQGEFQRFLTAKSDERGEILGKLYDNRAHQDFQLRLKAAEALLRKQDEDLAYETRLLTESFLIPEVHDADSDNRAAITPDHPDLIPASRLIIGQMTEERDSFRTLIKADGKALKALESERATAESDKKLLDDLDHSRAKHEALMERRAEMDDLRKRLDRAEAAEKVLVSETALIREQTALDGVLERIESLEREGEELAESAQMLKQRADEVREKNAPLSAGLSNRLYTLQNVLHFYDDLEAGLKEASRLQKEKMKAGELVTGAGVKLEAVKKNQGILEDKLDRLSSAGELAVSAAKRALDDLSQRRSELQKISDGIETAHRLETEESALKEALVNARRSEIISEEKHLKLNRAFIEGQAGILADDMRKRLETEETVVCPVCGAVHTAGDISSFAPCQSEAPSKDEVDEAYAAWEDARDSGRIAFDAYQKKQSELIRTKEGILERWGALNTSAVQESGTAIPVNDDPSDKMVCADQESQPTYAEAKNESRIEADGRPQGDTGQASHMDEAWKTLNNSDVLAGKTAECERLKAAASERYEHALEDQRKKQTALKEKEKNDAELALADEAYRRALEAQQAADLAAARAATSVANWRKQLEGYPESRGEAEKSIQSLTGQIDELARQVESALLRHSDCQNKQAENAGSLKAAYSEKEIRSRAESEARQRFKEALRTWSFSDEKDYRRTLTHDAGNDMEGTAGGVSLIHKTPDVEEYQASGNSAAGFAGSVSPGDLRKTSADLSSWILRSRNMLEEYDRERLDLEAAIRQLEESAKGKIRADIPAITDQINKLQARLDGLGEKEKDLDRMIRTDQDILNRLEDNVGRRAEIGKMLTALSPLAQTANGNYTFSRYVLSGFFDRIVEQANVHLDTMTDGEYQLVPTMSGDRRTSLGLGLKILNTLTNLERETASLSGGQMFEASLALALGLSDVVQMESTGTIRIDSMFIDEGFGSLDGARLDKAIEVLSHLSAGKRQIGIISHVARLDECLPRKIHVISGKNGSSVRLETDVCR